MKDKLPNCPYCKLSNWQFQQFGTDTNYFNCEGCFCTSPPKRTKKLAVKELMKLKDAKPILKAN